MVKIGSVTVEIFLIRTNVARRNVARTNVAWTNMISSGRYLAPDNVVFLLFLI